MKPNPHSQIRLRAKGLRSVKSKRVGAFGQFGPNFSQRQALASDADLLMTIEQ